MKRKQLRKGFTLVEAVAAIALLGIIAVMLLSAFYAQYHSIQLDAQNKASDKLSQQSLEKDLSGEFEDAGTLASRQSGTFSVDFGGIDVDADGDFVSADDNNGGFQYKYFEPGD